MKLTAHHRGHTHLQGQEEQHKYGAREVHLKSIATWLFDGWDGIDVGIMVTTLMAMEDLPNNKVARVEILEKRVIKHK
jgi:hypothetical protein